jgi:hypothetical protein
MNKILIILILIIFNARSEHNWYLDAGTKGMGIGCELKYKSLLFHIGSHGIIDYDNYDSELTYNNDSTVHRKVITCNLNALPYIGLGVDYNINKSITLQTFIDYLLMFKFGYEAIYRDNDASVGPGFNLDMPSSLYRIGLGSIYNNWKLPIGLLIDTYFYDFYNGGFHLKISPRLIIYL